MCSAASRAVTVIAFTLTLFNNGLGTCPPLRSKKGVSVKCSVPHLNSNLDCSGDLPPGAEAHYNCQKYYVNSRGDDSGGKLTCNQQGRWLRISEFRDFFCVPECGRPRNATFATLSSFIEREYEKGDEIFPWHAAIFKRYGESSFFKYTCGGTLLNPGNKGFVILTAAHCVTKNPRSSEVSALDSFRIVLGAISTEYRENSPGDSQIFKAKKIITEREYDPHSLQSDIAMIELSKPVKVSDTVQPACFPTRTIANSQVRPGVRGEIPVIRNDLLAYQEILKLPVSEQGQCLRDCAREPTITEFCTIHTAGSNSLATADSGTGLVFPGGSGKRKTYYMQGILTKIAGDVESCMTHDAYTSVSVFLDWVNRVHEELAEGQQFHEVVVPVKTTTHRPTRKTTSRPRPTERPVQTGRFPSSSSSIFETDYSRIGLDLHNFYRQKHHAPAVQLNGKLSREAQSWAEYLLRENKWEFSDGKDYSENIFQYFGKITPNDVIRKAVKNWYEASAKYNWDNPEASTFSQLVWKSTTHIGIGVATKGSKSVVVTNYWPKGNIYNIGDGDRAKYFRENVLRAGNPLASRIRDDIPLI